MTLIVGLNLSDRIYLWSDTRITFRWDGTYRDNIIKIAPLCWDPYLLLGQKKPNTILVAVAWNLQLTKYLYKKIKLAIQNKELSDDIRILSHTIQWYATGLYDEWLTDGNDYAYACLLFWGMFADRKKKIDLNKLKSLEMSINDTPIPPNIEDDMMKTDVAQLLLKQKGINLSEILHRPHKIHLSPILQEAIDGDSNDVNCPDSLVFGLTFSPTEWVSLQKAEWWEFIAYGTNGITQNHFSQDFLARMELPFWICEKDLNETLHIRDEIMHIAKDLNIDWIGGVVTPVVIQNNTYKSCFTHQEHSIWKEFLENVEEVYNMPDGFYFRKWNNLPIKLINFIDYQVTEKSWMII